MADKQRWLLRFAADIDLGTQTVSQAHRQMTELREDLSDAGFPTTDFKAFLAPYPEAAPIEEEEPADG